MVVSIAGVYAKFIVSAVAEGCADDAACILLRLAVEGEHHFSMVRMRIPGSVFILDNSHSAVQRFLHQKSFCSPCSMKMAHPYVSDADREIA